MNIPVEFHQGSPRLAVHRQTSAMVAPVASHGSNYQPLSLMGGLQPSQAASSSLSDIRDEGIHQN